MNTDLTSYYNDRANEYENVYHKPERQDDLALAERILIDKFSGGRIKEIACGTGFWTERISRTAKSIHAVDINKSVLDIARSKNYQDCNVTFAVEDIFVDTDPQCYDGVFGGFIWSHIKIQSIKGFLTTINRSAVPGGLIVFMDNKFVEGSNTPIAKTDEFGNTYQLRSLKNGTEHLVIKNFPTDNFLCKQLNGLATDFEIINLKYFWLLCYRTTSGKGSR